MYLYIKRMFFTWCYGIDNKTTFNCTCDCSNVINHGRLTLLSLLHKNSIKYIFCFKQKTVCK